MSAEHYARFASLWAISPEQRDEIDTAIAWAAIVVSLALLPL